MFAQLAAHAYNEQWTWAMAYHRGFRAATLKPHLFNIKPRISVEVRGLFLCIRDPARPLRWATLGHLNTHQSQETCASTCGFAYQLQNARTLSESVLAQYRQICKTAGQRPFPQVSGLLRISTERPRETCKDLKRPTLWATLGHARHASFLTLISDTLPSSLDGLATAKAASKAIDALASSSPAGCR